MTVLLTGGTGKAGLAIAAQLAKHNVPFILTSRRGPAGAPTGMSAVAFDWGSPSTFAPIFDQHEITSMVLVPPPGSDVATPMNPFIGLAKARGVRRFVMITGGSVRPGGPWAGQVYQHLEDACVEYSVLRLNWFNENFLEPHHVRTIRAEGRIYSGCGDGLAPLTALDDVAEVACDALMSEAPPQRDYLVCGPEYITYGQAARAIGRAIGREVVHVHLDREANERRLGEEGFSEFDQWLYARLEEETRTGGVRAMHEVEERAMEMALGREPLSFADWAERKKQAWM